MSRQRSKRLRRKRQRPFPKRVSERELVCEFVRCPADDRGVVHRLNVTRPHSGLDNRTPAEFAKALLVPTTSLTRTPDYSTSGTETESGQFNGKGTFDVVTRTNLTFVRHLARETCCQQ